MCRLPLIFMRNEEGLCDITLLVLDQKISYWLIKIMFLEEIETTIRSGIKLSLVSWAFNTSEAICGLCFQARAHRPSCIETNTAAPDFERGKKVHQQGNKRQSSNLFHRPWFRGRFFFFFKGRGTYFLIFILLPFFNFFLF